MVNRLVEGRACQQGITAAVLAAVVAGVMVGGCQGNSDSNGPIIHPQKDRIPGDLTPDHIISQDTTGASSTDLSRLARRLGRAETVQTISAEQGDTASIIGGVQDVAVTGNSVYVLDSENKTVKVYARSGEFLRSYGGPGEGPGEFRRPYQLELVSGSRFVVSDGDRTLAVFDRSGFQFQNSYEFRATSLCARGDTLYGTGLSPNDRGLIQMVSLDGGFITSFGEKYDTDHGLIRMQVSDGPIACVSRSGVRVVYAFGYLPYIWAYDEAHQRAWLTQIETFNGITLREEPDKSVRGYDNDQVHRIWGMTPLHGPYVLVQIDYHTDESREENRPYAELQTYVIDSRSGAGRYVGNTLPMIYSGAKNELWAGPNYPTPEVRRMKY